VIEREAVRHPPAAVVTGNRETSEAERSHDRHHVARKRTLGVRRVILGRCRTPAGAVAAQIRADDGEALGEQRRDLAPHQRGFRESMEQQHSRPRSGDERVDRGLPGVDDH
jgi:hypothetical protein